MMVFCSPTKSERAVTIDTALESSEKMVTERERERGELKDHKNKEDENLQIWYSA